MVVPVSIFSIFTNRNGKVEKPFPESIDLNSFESTPTGFVIIQNQNGDLCVTNQPLSEIRKQEKLQVDFARLRRTEIIEELEIVDEIPSYKYESAADRFIDAIYHKTSTTFSGSNLKEEGNLVSMRNYSFGIFYHKIDQGLKNHFVFLKLPLNGKRVYEETDRQIVGVLIPIAVTNDYRSPSPDYFNPDTRISADGDFVTLQFKGHTFAIDKRANLHVVKEAKYLVAA